jgi:hypothetical protein
LHAGTKHRQSSIVSALPDRYDPTTHKSLGVSVGVPSKFCEAMAGREATKRQSAMADEALAALDEHETWEAAENPSGHISNGSKWVFDL